MSTLLSCYVECHEAGEWVVPAPWLAPWNPIDDPEPPSGLRPRPLYRAANYNLAALFTNNVRRVPSLCTLPAFPSHHGLPPNVGRHLSSYASDCGETIWSNFWIEASGIADFDWHQQVVCSGQVDRDVAHLFTTPPAPFPRQEWPTNRPMTVARFLKDGAIVQWIQPLVECAAGFLSEYDRALKLLAGRQLRIVGWLSS